MLPAPGTWVLLALAVGFALGRRSALKGASHSPGPGSTGTSTGSGRPCRAGDGASERTSRTRSEQGADSTNSVATAADTHANLAAQRHHTLTDYPLSVQARLSGTVIPQTALSPASGRVPFVPLPSIIFYTNGVPGLLLEDALRPPIRGLHDADMVPTLSTTSREATLCIRWPGYSLWRAESSIDIYDHTNKGKPFTREEIAQQIAALVQIFYSDMLRLQPAHELAWPLSRIPFNKLHLVELRNVSWASWQPVFCCVV